MEKSKIIMFKVYPNIDFGYRANKFILSTFIILFCGCNNIDNITYEKCYNSNLETIKYTKYYFKIKKIKGILNYLPFYQDDNRYIEL